MTRVFVYEYLCGGGARPAGESPWASSLYREGRAMLAAVVADFQRIPDVEASLVLDERLPGDWPADHVTRVSPGQEEQAFRAATRSAEWTLVIAPEFDHILESRCRWVLEEGGRLLGPSLDAVALTSDKLALAHRFQRDGIPTPETADLHDYAVPEFPPPYVFKLRFGAGSQEMSFHVAPLTVEKIIETTCGVPMIVQHFHRGTAASISFVIGPRRTHALVPAKQHISRDGRFRYLGGRVPLGPRLARRARLLAQRAIAAVSGLHGYVGVDVVLGSATDGSEDAVIEINPRLTTSYIGLRELAEENLAELMLRLARGESVSKPHWRHERVHFTPDGRVERV